MKVITASVREKKLGTYPNRIHSFLILGDYPSYEKLKKEVLQHNDDLDTRTICFHDNYFTVSGTVTEPRILFLSHLDEETRQEWK